jgi:hypothetical protein
MEPGPSPEARTEISNLYNENPTDEQLSCKEASDSQLGLPEIE